MAVDQSASFGAQLRRHRLRAGLTQQALADRAGLSLRGLSDLERGARRAPYPDTIRRLSAALDLEESDVTSMLAAGRRSPVHAATVVKSQIPVPLTSFIGRERDLAELRHLLAETRLLTLTGAGGIGKTRRALAAVAQFEGDAVVFVDLAPIVDPALIQLTVAAALGIQERPGISSVDLALNVLGTRRVLLVLDNCEHLVDACAHLAERFLHGCPELRIMTTSREKLGVAGELVWAVPSLSLVEPGAAGRAHSEAVSLFVERARAAVPDFALTERSAPTVRSICRELDGIPLAIELAAARVGVLSVEQIGHRLDDRFALLTGGGRTAPPRQQTLRATLDWSYALLSPEEQRLFERLSIFVGGWTLDAAEAVSGQAAIGASATLDVLAHLVDKSLVQTERNTDGEVRYRLLESLRQFSRVRLQEGGDADETQRRHATHFLALAEAADPVLWEHRVGSWLERLEREHDNFRAALRWALNHRQTETALRLGGALGRFWWLRGYLEEGQRWLEEVLARAVDGTPASRAKALLAAGFLANARSDVARAWSLLNQSRALFQELGHRQSIARALDGLGNVASNRGDHQLATTLLEESLTLHRQLGEPGAVGDILNHLGIAASVAEDSPRAMKLFEESIELFRSIGDRVGLALPLGMLSWLETDLDRAATLAEESLAMAHDTGNRRLTILALVGLARVAYRRADYPQAAARFHECLTLAQELGTRREIGQAIEGAMWLASAVGLSRVAARLAGAAEAVRASIPAPLGFYQKVEHEQAVNTLRRNLDVDSSAAAWAQGRKLPLHMAIGAASEVLTAIAARSPGRSADSLTAREQEVAKRIARGFSNRQIAAELVISVKTAANHVDHILNKLGLHSRGQVAAWVRQRDLAERPTAIT